ncbi:MAG: hypothetical protein K1X51_13165 [Rhodospirillaceae bacterium]|nr:hypothetical protein [Rhodospirillaceae bacterium]
MSRIVLVLLILLGVNRAAVADVETTDPQAFVAAFIHHIGEAESLRVQAQKDVAAAGDDKGAAIISSSAKLATALRGHANQLNSFQLPPPMGGAPQKFATLLQQKAELFETYVAVLEALAGTPRAGVIYEKLAGKSPDLRGMIENADETLMKATPLVFATLINTTPDAQGYVNRLTITKAQRETLIHELDTAFGDKLEAKSQNYIVAAAQVLKADLHRPFKCSDEP